MGRLRTCSGSRWGELRGVWVEPQHCQCPYRLDDSYQMVEIGAKLAIGITAPYLLWDQSLKKLGNFT